jgi:hypothetical protein
MIFFHRMKNKIVGMEANMEQLLAKVCIVPLLVYGQLIFTCYYAWHVEGL